MKTKIVSAILLTLLLLGMLTLAFNIQPVKADWWDPDVKVTPEHPGLNDLVNVTVSFTFPNLPPYVEEFGPLNHVGNTFFVNVTVYLPGPWDPIYFLQHTEEYVYHLGNLCAGQYKFEVYVERINNMVGYGLERTVEFVIWEYIFEDTSRGTMLRISSNGKYFQFIAPNKTFSVKHDHDMIATTHFIFIDYGDSEIVLRSIAIITRRWSFCIAIATDVETGTRQLLIDLNKPSWCPVGDADVDGDVDTNDFYVFSGCYGMSIENSSYNPLADFNEDGYVNSEDFYILSGNYGKTAR